MKISILTPVYNTPSPYLEKAFSSIVNQTHRDWEWCIVNDGGTSASTEKEISEIIKHPNVKYLKFEKNSGIGAATSAAFNMASGDIIAFMDHDDELTPDALQEVSDAFVKHDPDCTYSDEAIIGTTNNVKKIHYKPEFSPHYLACSNYMCHFIAVKREIYKKVGGVRSGYDGAQDHEFLLRVSEITSNIYHIPKVLYYWRSFPTTFSRAGDSQIKSSLAGRKAVAESLTRRGYPNSDVHLNNDGTPQRMYFYYHTKCFTVKPKVSIVILFKDHETKLFKCIRSILNNAQYDNYEIIVTCCDLALFNNMLVRYPQLKSNKIRAIQAPRQLLNFPKLLNFGCRHATGDYIITMHDGITVTNTDWIEQLLTYAVEPNVGAVSGKILDKQTSRIIYAGAYLHKDLITLSYFNGMPDNQDFWSRGYVTQDVSVAYSNLMMFSKATFNSLNGFNEAYVLYHSDLDFCLRLADTKKHVVYIPTCKFFYSRNETRKTNYDPIKYSTLCKQDTALFKEAHKEVLDKPDKYLNPELLKVMNPLCIKSDLKTCQDITIQQVNETTTTISWANSENLVSFILPWYKDQTTAIPSLLAQMHKNVELIVVYDGPIPKEYEYLIAAYRDPRIKLCNTPIQSNNWGHTPRNFGIDQVSTNSKYIVFTSMDNYYFPNFAKEMVNAFNTPSITAVYGDFYYNFNNYEKVNSALQLGKVDCGCVMVRTDVSKRVRWMHTNYEADWGFLADVIKVYGRDSIKKLPRSLYVHN